MICSFFVVPLVCLYGYFCFLWVIVECFIGTINQTIKNVDEIAGAHCKNIK